MMPGNDGRLPESLADIKEVPVPNDPYTGNPFQYQVQGNTATITAGPPAGKAFFPGSDWIVEMTFQK